jgi:hypothetical protein
MPSATGVLLQPLLLQVAARAGEGDNLLRDLWLLFSKVKGAVEDGHRLENLSWRLWHKTALAHPTDARQRTQRSADSGDCAPEDATAAAQAGRAPTRTTGAVAAWLTNFARIELHGDRTVPAPPATPTWVAPAPPPPPPAFAIKSPVAAALAAPPVTAPAPAAAPVPPPRRIVVGFATAPTPTPAPGPGRAPAPLANSSTASVPTAVAAQRGHHAATSLTAERHLPIPRLMSDTTASEPETDSLGTFDPTPPSPSPSPLRTEGFDLQGAHKASPAEPLAFQGDINLKPTAASVGPSPGGVRTSSLSELIRRYGTRPSQQQLVPHLHSMPAGTGTPGSAAAGTTRRLHGPPPSRPSDATSVADPHLHGPDVYVPRILGW